MAAKLVIFSDMTIKAMRFASSEGDRIAQKTQ